MPQPKRYIPTVALLLCFFGYTHGQLSLGIETGAIYIGFLIEGDALAAKQGRTEDVIIAGVYLFSTKIA
jgi:hypothetical protein